MAYDIAVNAQPPSLNDALDELVQAIEQVQALEGLRVGLQGYGLMLAAIGDSDTPEAQQARELEPVWAALDALAYAVQTRRESDRAG